MRSHSNAQCISLRLPGNATTPGLATAVAHGGIIYAGAGGRHALEARIACPAAPRTRAMTCQYGEGAVSAKNPTASREIVSRPEMVAGFDTCVSRCLRSHLPFPKSLGESTEERPFRTPSGPLSGCRPMSTGAAPAWDCEQVRRRLRDVATRDDAQQTRPMTASSDLADELRTLNALREEGLLTDDEFDVQKAKLLGCSGPV
jgi:Short C-terminal domain